MRLAAVAKNTEELELGGLDGALGFRLRLAHTAINRDIRSTLGELGLTQTQIAALWLIESNPGTSQHALAKTLSIDSATVVALLDRLEHQSFITRTRARPDRRRHQLHLTAAGEEILAQAKENIVSHERHLTSRLSRQELTTLMNALEKLAL